MPTSSPQPTTERTLRLTDLLREDWRMNSPRAVVRPGFHVLAVHRIGHAAGSGTGPAHLPLRLVRAGLTFLSQVVYGIELPWQATVGRRLVIGHHAGIVVAGNASIGDDCLIRQNVTIGMVAEGGRSPRIGNRVQIGAGAVILGDIEVGDGAIIGPNAVVTTDVPAGARVVAAPSRILVGFVEASSAGRTKEQAGDGSARADEIASLIRDTLGLNAVVEPDTPVLSSGLVDSLNLVVLLDAIESRYGVEVPPEEISAESFDTPQQIADYLRNRA